MPARKKIAPWFRNKYQRFRERICAPIVFTMMDLVGFRRHLPFTCTGEDAQRLIYEKLMSDRPCMIGRIGATEIRNIEGCLHKNDSFLKKLELRLTLHQVGIEEKFRKAWKMTAENNPDDDFFDEFTRMMMEDAGQLDVFASWRWEETGVFREPYPFDVISLGDLEPFFSKEPWTRALAGKKVLVIQPFCRTIESQYRRREKLFRNQDVLPEFTLTTYAPFFRGLREDPENAGWFDKLNCMKKEISALDFDVALIAAGAYGFPLAAHIKRTGKKSVLMGGVLQLLFGIRGARWDSTEYAPLYNQYWVRPGDEDRPKIFSVIDGGCYW